MSLAHYSTGLTQRCEEAVNKALYITELMLFNYLYVNVFFAEMPRPYLLCNALTSDTHKTLIY